jgi:hypothetical protein
LTSLPLENKEISPQKIPPFFVKSLHNFKNISAVNPLKSKAKKNFKHIAFKTNYENVFEKKRVKFYFFSEQNKFFHVPDMRKGKLLKKTKSKIFWIKKLGFFFSP